MDTENLVESLCSVCGQKSLHPMLGDASSSGASDLDGRPPPPLRDSISSWLQECPHCGYCSRSIEEENALARETISSLRYTEQLQNNSFHPLANRFLCAALLEEARGMSGRAARFMCYAAWACDDTGNDEAARSCRLMAVDTALNAAAREVVFFEERPDLDIVVIVDMLRRAGEFENALASIRGARRAFPDPLAQSLLDVEEELSEKRDASAHLTPETPA